MDRKSTKRRKVKSPKRKKSKRKRRKIMMTGQPIAERERVDDGLTSQVFKVP